MRFNVSGIMVEPDPLLKREIAYYELMRKLANGVPCLEGSPELMKQIMNRGKPTFDFEFIGFRAFEISRAKL